MNIEEVKSIVKSEFKIESTRKESHNVKGSNPVFISTKEFITIGGCEIRLDDLCRHHSADNVKHDIEMLIKNENCEDGKMYFF